MFIKKLFLFIYIFFTINLIFPDATNDKTTDIPLDQTNDFINIDYQGESLTIFGTQEKTQQIKTIKKEEIEKINPQDLPSLLKQSLNLSISRYGTYGTLSSINIRGLSGARILILINGIPMNSAQSGDLDLSLIPVNDIEEIQIIKGGSDTKYNFSGAAGGIINIITKKKRKSGYKISGSISNLFYYPDFYYLKSNDEKSFSKFYDFFDTQKITFGFGIGNEKVYWDINAGGDRAFNHFIYEDEYKTKRRMTNSEVWDASTSTSLTLTLPLYMKIIFSGNYFYTNKNIHGPMTSTTHGKQIDQIASGSISYDADYVGNEKIDTELIINYKFQSLNYINSDANDLHNTNTVNVINKWGFIITDWLTINLGGDFEYDYFDSTKLEKINSFNGGGYTTFEFSILSIAKIIPSIKLVYYKLYPIAIPKLGFVFYLGKYFTLKNNYYRTFKLPSLNDLYWPDTGDYKGNPYLKPEDGIGGDIILSFKMPKILSAESSVYINYILNGILWQSGSNGWEPKNIGEVFYFGIDNEVKSEFNKHVQLVGSYSYLLTFVLYNEYTFESDKKMLYQPMHTLGFGVHFNWKNGNLNFIGHFESERFTSISNAYKLDPFFTLDINFNQTIKLVTLFASIKNVFNTFYFLREEYPLPGGSVTLGFKINYDHKFKNKVSNKDKNNNLTLN